MCKNEEKAPTIYDVAKEAGVSPATVSRVMNHYSQVKRETSEKVIAAMKKLEFQRNEAKSSSQLLNSSVNLILSSSQPRIFLLSIPHTASSPYAEFIEGAQSAAQKNGHYLLVNSTPVNEYNFDFFITIMKSHNIAGVITTETIAASDLLKINNYLPLVQCGEYNASVEQLSYVSIDDISMARSAAGLLRESGAENIVYVTAPVEQQTLRRSQGVQQAILQQNQGLQQTMIQQNQESQQTLAAGSGSFHPDFLHVLHSTNPVYAVEQMTAMLKKLAPDAVLTSNALQAAFVLRAAHTLGISVPSRLQVLSLEDSPPAAYFSPAISAMSIAYYEIGFRAFELLLSEFLDPYTQKQHILLTSEYIRRETTLETRKETLP